MSDDLRKVIGLIPEDQREPVSTALLDLLLKTKNTTAVPATDAKRVMHMISNDSIYTPFGLETLFTCTLKAEPVKALEVLGEVLGERMKKEEYKQSIELLSAYQ